MSRPAGWCSSPTTPTPAQGRCGPGCSRPPGTTSPSSSPTPPAGTGGRARPTSRSARPASWSYDDHAGRVDGYGNPLAVTAPALADEVAGAADLAQGKLAGRPVAAVRGLGCTCSAPTTRARRRSLNRPLAEDMFALGAREAVVAALAGESAEAFGTPAPTADLVAALARVGVTATADGDRVRLAGEAGPEVRAVAHAHGWVTDRDIPAVLQPHLP